MRADESTDLTLREREQDSPPFCKEKSRVCKPDRDAYWRSCEAWRVRQ